MESLFAMWLAWCGGVRCWSGGGMVVVQNNERVKKNGYLKITSPMNHMKPSIQ